MNQESLAKVASHDGETLKASQSIGYAINLMMDYGSGRQVTISGTLPLGASLDEMNAELDKLRLATNRQANLVVRPNVENTVAMARKTKAAMEVMLSEYEREIEVEISRVGEGPKGTHTITKSQIENLRSQALNFRLTKKNEIAQAQNDVDKGVEYLARIEKELEGTGGV